MLFLYCTTILFGLEIPGSEYGLIFLFTINRIGRLLTAVELRLLGDHATVQR